MKKSLLITILILVLIYGVGGIIYFYLKDDKEEVVEKISEIKNYPYTLKSNATEYIKNEFAILKVNLESNEINEEEFASSIAKLFIADLYTISNKINKYDIGGLDYVFPSAVDNYKLKVKETLYKYVEDNDKGKRTQKLPQMPWFSRKFRRTAPRSEYPRGLSR